jgi:hypothetical protein
MKTTGSSETMENFYQKPKMEGGGSPETTANFYKKPPKLLKIPIRNLKWREEVPPKLQPPKLWKMSTRNLKLREEVSPKLQQIPTRSLRNFRKFLPQT